MVNKTLSRREFICTLGGACILSACSQPTPSRPPKPIRLCKATELKEGPNIFGVERVVIFKEGKGIYSVSLVCTHQQCMVRMNEDRFECACHGAMFDLEGVVTRGPAVENLYRYEIRIDSDGYVEVNPAVRVSSDWRLSTIV